VLPGRNRNRKHTEYRNCIHFWWKKQSYRAIKRQDQSSITPSMRWAGLPEGPRDSSTPWTYRQATASFRTAIPYRKGVWTINLHMKIYIYSYFVIYDLFNDAVIRANYIALNDRVINEGEDMEGSLAVLRKTS
jgi:hypothetical protein